MLITGVWLEGVSNGGVNSRGAINRTGHAINGGVNNRGVSNGGIYKLETSLGKNIFPSLKQTSFFQAWIFSKLEKIFFSS